MITTPRRDAEALFKALENIKEYNDMRTSQLQCLLYVASNEGCFLNDVQKAVNLSQASISRNISALSKVAGRNKKGYGLIQKKISIHDPRYYELYLTDEGKILVSKLLGS